ncbi:hypothetical protein ACFQY7_48620 [Actinomadura luteofluorescens]|uniref:hypothetical protein n=1 Tax=Actinomadura luteofluorescens TaxID=46163 RepID=UPI003626DF09
MRHDRAAFWLSPVWSSARAWRPSMSAAVASTWFTVTTPVPPMPTSSTSADSGRASGSSSSPIGASVRAALGLPPGRTVTNEGQSPSTHE